MKPYLEQLLRDALLDLGITEDCQIQLEKPKQQEHGDVSTNIAMVLAKKLGQNPRNLATQIVERLHLDQNKISSVNIAGPGFINFVFSDRLLTGSLEEIFTRADAYGRSEKNKGRSVNLEWVSANPTGPLHAGHGRQVCLGATLCNLLEWTGWNVTREYYFNNAGNQMQNLAITVRERYLELCGMAVNEENVSYVGEYIWDIARDILEEFKETKTEESLDFFKKRGESWCFDKIKKTLDALLVHHDIFFNEQSLYDDGKIELVLSELRERGLAYDQDGAVWLRTTTFGTDKDRVIIKNTGEPTYRLPDIAYHRDKVLRKYDRIIDIFGADHIATFPDVISTVKALGFPTDHIQVIIHQMVSFVHEGEAVKMSKRSGNVYYLDDLIGDVGADAVRYFFVMRSANAHLEFDVNLAREQNEKNPVYYLQYAHARIASIIRFSEREGYKNAKDVRTDLLTHASELSLMRALLEFPNVVDSCSESLEPHHLCTYLQNLATAFHKFYHDCRVVIEDTELRGARIALCVSTRQVLANGLHLLGVHAPESM